MVTLLKNSVIDLEMAAGPKGQLVQKTSTWPKWQLAQTRWEAQAGPENRGFVFLLDFWPQDGSQRLQNDCRIHLGQFLGPGDHSGSIPGHFGDFGPDLLSEASTI